MIEEQKVYRCQIGVNIKEGYLGFEESRIVAFKIHSEIINCVTTADEFNKEEYFGNVNRLDEQFLREIMRRYPDIVDNAEAVMDDVSCGGEKIYLDVTFWYESQHPPIFAIVRYYVKICNDLHPTVEPLRYE